MSSHCVGSHPTHHEKKVTDKKKKRRILEGSSVSLLSTLSVTQSQAVAYARNNTTDNLKCHHTMIREYHPSVPIYSKDNFDAFHDEVLCLPKRLYNISFL